MKITLLVVLILSLFGCITTRQLPDGTVETIAADQQAIASTVLLVVEQWPLIADQLLILSNRLDEMAAARDAREIERLHQRIQFYLAVADHFLQKKAVAQ